MQIVGYEPTPDAGLLVAENRSVDRIPLTPSAELAFGLGDRHCAGTISNGRHERCTAESVPWCSDHVDTWICARCRGTCLKPEMDCFQEHVVYLAMVAPATPKVGVTKANRIATRLHEQGADRGAVVHHVKDGRIAREIEAEIGEELPERISVGAKQRSLTQSIDEDAWDDLIASFDVAAVHEPAYELALPSTPIPETIASGSVCGTKGRLVVLEQGGSTYVTDLRDLVGYHVHPGEAPPALQRGLAAFH